MADFARKINVKALRNSAVLRVVIALSSVSKNTAGYKAALRVGNTYTLVVCPTRTFACVTKGPIFEITKA